MKNADKIACEPLYKPKSEKYDKDIRTFQGCPTLAVTNGGRIYLGWYAGGTGEPHMENYNLLIYSDDHGVTWSKPLIVIPSSYENRVHALDIQLFTDPSGALHLAWVQNNTDECRGEIPEPHDYQPVVVRDGWVFPDMQHSEWEIVCRNPDADEPEFSEPRFLFHGFLRCKPTFLKNGSWIYCAYDQLTDRYGYYISRDCGKTFTHYAGAKKIPTWFDETMAYQLEDGRVRMLARTSLGELAEAVSADNGETWGPSALSGIVCADTRFFVKKLPSGRVLLITNDHRTERRNMTLLLSEDDGKTWKYKKCIDTRSELSYPDADLSGEDIYLSYDRGRITEREILFCRFREQDIIENNEIPVSLVSKPEHNIKKQDVLAEIDRTRLIAIVRGVASEKLLPLASALYEGGIRLLEVTFDAGGQKTDQETAAAIKALAEKFRGKMYIGAGTVLTKEQVRLTKKAGGSFVISPNTDRDVITESRMCGLVSIPGAMTATEIQNAHRLGADYVKLFPVSVLGPAYVKALKAPLKHIKMLAVGGIHPEDVGAYREAGIGGFGVGSNIVNTEALNRNDYDAITALARRYAEAVKNG